jgi:uncharacterized protein YgiM (DUF1202 family)
VARRDPDRRRDVGTLFRDTSGEASARIAGVRLSTLALCLVAAGVAAIGFGTVGYRGSAPLTPAVIDMPMPPQPDRAADRMPETAAASRLPALEVEPAVSPPRTPEASAQPLPEPPEAVPAAVDAGDALAQAKPASEATAAGRDVVVTRSSNLRSVPDFQATVITRVRRGETVRLLEDAPVFGYVHVAYGDRQGWLWALNLAEDGSSAASSSEPAGGADR